MALELVPKEVTASPESSPADAGRKIPYQGQERRRAMQRQCVDRREMVRFEMKVDRRSGVERRAELAMWNGRDT